MQFAIMPSFRQLPEGNCKFLNLTKKKNSYPEEVESLLVVLVVVGEINLLKLWVATFVGAQEVNLFSTDTMR